MHELGSRSKKQMTEAKPEQTSGKRKHFFKDFQLSCGHDRMRLSGK